MKSIPIKSAEAIAKEFGYDQVIIVARKVGNQGGEHVTTYGRDKKHCDIAAECGEFLKYKIMKWHDVRLLLLEDTTEEEELSPFSGPIGQS